MYKMGQDFLAIQYESHLPGCEVPNTVGEADLTQLVVVGLQQNAGVYIVHHFDSFSSPANIDL